MEVQQLELVLQLLSLRCRSAALEEALAVADPGSAAGPRQAVGKLAGVSLQCQGAIAGGSVYSRPFGRPWRHVRATPCSPHCVGCLCCSPPVAVLWAFLAPVACLCLDGAMLVHCMSS